MAGAMDTQVIADSVLVMGAAVAIVPLSQRLGLGSVIGYLAAGVVVGPAVAGVVTEPESILQLSEFGVVLLLFLIGLELEPKRLWAMRRDVFGMGGLQVLLTGAALAGVALAFGLDGKESIVIGAALALSSTAFAIQLLNEKNELTLPHGQKAFSVLLFQDLAVVPIVAAVPLLAAASGAADEGFSWTSAGIAAGAIIAVIIAGHFLLRPLLGLVARWGSHELRIAAALLVILGVSWLMLWAGLSMALGAFLAGVLLSDSEYKHELEANVEPFKGLLLGLFFIAVGMSAELQLLIDQPLVVLGIAVGLVAIKLVLLWPIGRRAGLSGTASVCFAVALAQGGEFAFVIFNLAVGEGVVGAETAAILTLSVTFSMVLTPILFVLRDLWLRRRKSDTEATAYDEIVHHDHDVIIAGFGRFGQIVGRVLQTKSIGFTAVDTDSEQVQLVRRFGNRVFYGDLNRPEILRSAGADKAKALVIAVDDADESVRMAHMAKKEYPNLRIFARARNRRHAHRLMDLGVDYVIRSTYVSSLELATSLLESLGLSAVDAIEAARVFREHDEKLLREQAEFFEDDDALVRSTAKAAEDLSKLMKQDAKLSGTWSWPEGEAPEFEVDDRFAS